MGPARGSKEVKKMEDYLRKFAKKRKLTKCSKEILELIYQNKDIPFSIWSKEKSVKSKNVFCSLTCIKCGRIERKSTKYLAKRTLILEEICTKCGKYEIYNRKEWLRANSEAQKKIQSTPEQKRKNAEGVSKFWKNNPDIKEQVRQKLLSYYEDPKYKKMVADSRSKNFHALSGKYKFRNKWVEFGSSYELCFLLWLENKTEYQVPRKCKFHIEYEYKERIRYYYPDYILLKNNEKILVEIKSKKYPFFDEEKNNAKIKYTEKFIANNNIDKYWFIDEDIAKNIGLIFKRSSRIKKTCKDLYSEDKLILFSKEKKKRYIGE